MLQRATSSERSASIAAFAVPMPRARGSLPLAAAAAPSLPVSADAVVRVQHALAENRAYHAELHVPAQLRKIDAACERNAEKKVHPFEFFYSPAFH